MYFWYFPRNRHECSPLPTDKTGTELRASHVMDCAAYQFYEVTYKISECPVCGNQFKYDYSTAKVTDKIVTYKEFNAILKKEQL